MSRSSFDKHSSEKLAACIREIEANTDAEIVVVVRRRSAQYSDADYAFGAIASFVMLWFMLFSKATFGPILVAIAVPVTFAIGVLISSRTEFIRRLLTTKRFRANAVRAGAAAMFYEAGIANTSNEMGVLIYLSLFERRLELLADRGVLNCLPPLQWNECLFEIKQAGRRVQFERFMAALRHLGELFAEHIPATGENPNELPDMPRFDFK